MASIRINSHYSQPYLQAAGENSYTVYVPAIVHNLPDSTNDPGYTVISTKAELNEYYVKSRDIEDNPTAWGPTTNDEAVSYNYALGLILAGYKVLLKPLTTNTGALVTTIIDDASDFENKTALGRLFAGTNMDIRDLYLYQVDFITDGGLIENLADSVWPEYITVNRNMSVSGSTGGRIITSTPFRVSKVSELTVQAVGGDPSSTHTYTLQADPTNATSESYSTSDWVIPIKDGETPISGTYPKFHIQLLSNMYNIWWAQRQNTEDTSWEVSISFKYGIESTGQFPNTRAALGAEIYKNLQEVAAARQDCIVIPGLYEGCTADQAPGYLASLLSTENISAPYGPGYEIQIEGAYPKYPVTTNKTYRMDGAYIFLVTLANAMANGVDPWLPPAGVNRMIVPNNARNPEYPVGGTILNTWQGEFISEDTTTPVNPIMNIPNYGYTVFGQRSLVPDASASEPSVFKNLTTQLTSALVHRAIFNVGLSITFDQNVVNTWTKFKTRLGSILQRIESDGGITDYLIIMDETTTTEADLLANRLNGKVYISVPSIVESIVIDFYIEPQSVTFVTEAE